MGAWESGYTEGGRQQQLGQYEMTLLLCLMRLLHSFLMDDTPEHFVFCASSG